MKTKLILVMVALLTGACGMLGGGGGLAVTHKDGSGSVDAKSTAMIVDTVGDSSSNQAMVSHTFIVANYDLPEKVTKMALQGSAKEDGRMRVEITIIGKKGTTKSTPVEPGEYKARVGNVGSPESSVNGGRILVGSDGKEASTYVGGADMKEGKVTIASVDGDMITGEVDITDGTNSIKGKFSVKAS